MPKREDWEILVRAIPKYSNAEPLFLGHVVNWSVFIPARDHEFVGELMDKIEKALRKELYAYKRGSESNLSNRSNS